MKKFVLLLTLLALNSFAQTPKNIIIITAHPDEAEEYAGGTIAILSEAGHNVKILSLTNGDVGHWKMTKEDLAKRRFKEAQKAAKILGAKYEILCNHDGELENNVKLRKLVVQKIREWKAEVVFSFKTAFGGGHPDNMAAGIAVQQGAGLASAPLFMPEIPVLKNRPIFFLMLDYYTKQFVHSPDLVIPIDKTYEKKLLSFDAHASQFYEFAPYQRNILNEIHDSTDSWQKKRNFLEKYWEEFSAVTPEMLKWLNKWYGQDASGRVKHGEEFLLAKFSRKPGKEELLELFPVLRNFPK